ncbi:MAG TPA: twin-arginine translocase subunit TatC [Flavobacteriales bacterium]|nr:twin-arginine translocase subunit TatC [Flavobacteriales bacterium]|tara:strand:- start:3243 stop:4070 length:828 start_codon:yes stop_codon:yes gene_type:complete
MPLDQLEDQPPQDVEMGFLDHLEELRKRLFYAAFFIVAGGIGLFVAKDWLFNVVLFGPRQTDFISFRAWCQLSEWIGAGESLCVDRINYELINTTMLGNFTTHILVSAIAGFIAAFPFVFWQGWLFIRPALKDNERHSARGIGFSSSFLFFLGVAFGYYVIAPLSLQFLGNYELGDVQSRISVMSYMKTVASITLASGLVFQLPMMVYFFSRAGLVTPELLKRYRRHALVGILIVSALITPPDVTSQVLVSLPVLVLYELSIVIAKRVYGKRTNA